MSKRDDVVMYESEEAARRATLTGWVDRHGHFWGEDEHMARYAGCTHRPCDTEGCGAVIERTRTVCDPCYQARRDAEFDAYPSRTWANEPLYSHSRSAFYFDADELPVGNQAEWDELRLAFCRPVHAHEIDVDDVFCDRPDDVDFPDEVVRAFEALNAALKNCKTPMWWEVEDVRALRPAVVAEAAQEAPDAR